VVPARHLLLALVQVELVMVVRVLGLLVPLVLTVPHVLVLVRDLLAHLAPHVLVVPVVHLVLLAARLVVLVAVVLVAALADLEVHDQVAVDGLRAVVVVVVVVVKMIYRHQRSLIAKTQLQFLRALSLLSVAYLRKNSGHV
jgi:hypothetical protein